MKIKEFINNNKVQIVVSSVASLLLFVGSIVLIDNSKDLKGQVSLPPTSCVDPTTITSPITENTKLCTSGSPYTITAPIEIGAPRIELDCDGAVLDAPGLPVGIENSNYNNVIIKNCEIFNAAIGIEIIGTSTNIIDHNVIINNKVHNNNTGLNLSYTKRSTVIGNTAYQNTNFGILLYESFDNTIASNSLTNNAYGISLNGNTMSTSNKNNTVIDNHVTDNTIIGIVTANGDSSNSNILRSNFACSNTFDIEDSDSIPTSTGDKNHCSVAVGWDDDTSPSPDCTYTCSEIDTGNNECTDGNDNDGDGLIDTDDSDCNNILTNTIAVGSNPYGIGVNSSTNIIYAVNAADNTVSVIDGNSEIVTNTISVGSGPRGIGVNPVTNMIYVSNDIGNTVSVINGNSNTVINTISVGSGPRGIGVNPVTNIIYVANLNSNTVSVINGNTDIVTNTIAVGSAPYYIGVNPVTNMIYVTHANNNTVSVINGNSETVTNIIPLGSSPYGVGVNSVTNMIYVANIGNNTVSVVNGITEIVTNTIAVGSNPYGIGVDSSTNIIYAVNVGNNTISVIDGNSETVTNTIAVGSTPYGVGINTVTNMAYVTNISDNTVSVINGASGSNCITPSPGDTITGHVTFCSDMSGGGSGLKIGSDDTVIDCNNKLLKGMGVDVGINLDDGMGGDYDNVVIKNCNFEDWTNGIYVLPISDQTVIYNNNFHNLLHNNIDIRGTNSLIVSSNITVDSGFNNYNGINIYGGALSVEQRSRVYDNNISGQYYGIGISQSDNSAPNNLSVLMGNILNDNSQAGLGIDNSDFIIAINNTTDSNEINGIFLTESIQNGFLSNFSENNLTGVGLYDADSNLFDANYISSNNNIGINIEVDSDNNDFSENLVFGNGYGISLSSSDTNNFFQNKIYDNTNNGMYVTNSLDNTLTSNGVTGNNIGIESINSTWDGIDYNLICNISSDADFDALPSPPVSNNICDITDNNFPCDFSCEDISSTCEGLNPTFDCTALTTQSACEGSFQLITDPNFYQCQWNAFPFGGGDCEPSTITCNVACGNGIIEGTEQCDDGNTDPGDGCSDICEIEIGWQCAGQPSVCSENCGNGTLEMPEECDDGINNSNLTPDACRTTCEDPSCGDFIVDPNSGEECEPTQGECSDNNATCLEDPDCNLGATCDVIVNNDCDSNCQFIVPVCGDGNVDSGEECDDGNANANDACKNDCTDNICGDGVVNIGIEQCDDGNINNNDACKNDCTTGSTGGGGGGGGNGYSYPGSHGTYAKRNYEPPVVREVAPERIPLVYGFPNRQWNRLGTYESMTRRDAFAIMSRIRELLKKEHPYDLTTVEGLISAVQTPGIAIGYGDGFFPERPVTWAQYHKLLLNAINGTDKYHFLGWEKEVFRDGIEQGIIEDTTDYLIHQFAPMERGYAIYSTQKGLRTLPELKDYSSEEIFASADLLNEYDNYALAKNLSQDTFRAGGTPMPTIAGVAQNKVEQRLNEMTDPVEKAAELLIINTVAEMIEKIPARTLKGIEWSHIRKELVDKGISTIQMNQLNLQTHFNEWKYTVTEEDMRGTIFENIRDYTRRFFEMIGKTTY